MENKALFTSDSGHSSLAEFIEAHRAELVSSYHQVLQEGLFNRRTTIRPRMLKEIASDEVDSLLQFFTQPDFSGIEHGGSLYKKGLSEQVVLRIGQVTRQLLLSALAGEGATQALDSIDSYQETVILGYIQAQERSILREQELIRSALQTAVSRYTVEIREIEEMAQKATEANQFKSQFIARMGHELRTPLGAMLGMTQMLHEGIYGALSPEQKDLTQRIINNALVLKQIFTELLDQSQIESGQLRLRIEPFSPQDLIRSVHSNYLPLALKKGLSMQVKIGSNLSPAILGDKARIEQIVSNLVVNAIKYTDTGSILLRAYKANATHWGIEVIDTGIGIAPEHIDHVFEPFRQTDESSSRQYGGVGLGLAIVQQLVAVMNGKVEVKSKFGKGSSFTVTLPLQLAE